MPEPTVSAAAKFKRSMSPDKDMAPRTGAGKDGPEQTGSKRNNSMGGGRSGSRSASSNGGAAKKTGCWAAAGSSITPAEEKAVAKAGAVGGQWSGVKTDFQQQHELKIMKDTLTFDALFKRYELAKAFSLDQSQVRKDAKRVKQRLYEANRFLLNPESRGMQAWDVMTMIALLFTLLVSPYEIGFLEGYSGFGADVLFGINQGVTVVFATVRASTALRALRCAHACISHTRCARTMTL